MQIPIDSHTAAAGFSGGLMIGLAALLLYAGAGRIAGISGLLYGWVLERGESWRGLFLLGLIAGGWLAAIALGAPPPPRTAWPLLLVAGLLVGFGTRLGSGCTSGHGVCGLARLSPRSLLAVLLFIATGMLSATLLRPLLT